MSLWGYQVNKVNRLACMRGHTHTHTALAMNTHIAVVMNTLRPGSAHTHSPGYEYSQTWIGTYTQL